MNQYETAILEKYHITNCQHFVGQNWNDFEKIAYGKKIVIYGVSNAIEAYIERYGKKFKIDCIVDKSEAFHGTILSQEKFDYCYYPDNEESLRIKNPISLNRFAPENTIILIASIRRYEEIAIDLEKQGFTHIFSIFVMESNTNTNSRFKKKDIDLSLYCCEKFQNIGIASNKISTIINWHGGHSFSIFKEIQKEYPNYFDLVYLIKNKSTIIKKNDGMRSVFIDDVDNYYLELFTSKVILIDEIAVSEIQYKRKNQIVIQLKHWSSVTLKKFGILETMNMALPSMDDYLNTIHETNHKTDYIMVGSRFDEKTCREGFEFEGECLYVGSPRTDVVFEQKWNNIIRKYYNIPENGKIILYAPTYRYMDKNKSNDCTYQNELDFCLLKKCLEQRFGNEWYVLLRLHPIVARMANESKYPEFVINASDYANSFELVAAADVMISDYSSIMFETAFLYRPVFLFAYDKSTYVNSEKELLLDYDMLPFSISETNEQLATNIRDFEEVDYKNKLKKFFTDYGVSEDGNASRRAAMEIYNIIIS